MVVWGGIDGCCAIDSIIHSPEAVAYDPDSDAWRVLAPVPEPWSGDDGSTVSVGFAEQMVVWRQDQLGSYHTKTNAWVPLPQQPSRPEPEFYSTASPYAVGTAVGTDVLLWIGDYGDEMLGMAFDMTTEEWRDIAHLETHGELVSLTGNSGMAWSANFTDRGVPVQRYEVTTDRCRDLPAPPLSARRQTEVFGTEAGLIVWGGYTDDGEIEHDGAIFDPEPGW